MCLSSDLSNSVQQGHRNFAFYTSHTYRQWGIMKNAAFDSRMCACLARLPGLAGSVTLLTGPKRAKVSLTASSHNADFMVEACTCVPLTLTGDNLSAIGTGECPLIFAEMFICSPKVGLNLTA